MRSEVSEKMVIPSIINVGFQNRSDTYTKKLAYVIYTDAKGKLRKEASWQGWRDKKIKPLDFKNEPMSGFVLNKKVGGHKSDWNFRNAYVRIYDPRDFEFEISVENLLFILQETSSIKGKGLEGEFVYAWHGKDLVLLPVETDSYKQCANFTKKQTQKVTKADIKEGHSYLMKDMTNVMYLGKLPYCNQRGWSKYFYEPVGLHHVFLNLDKGGYIALSGYTKLAEVTSTDTAAYANKLTAYKRSPFFKTATGIEFVPRKVTLKDLELKPNPYGHNNQQSEPVYVLTKTESGYSPTILIRYDEIKQEWNGKEYIKHPLKTTYKMWVGPVTEYKFDGIGCELTPFDQWSLRKQSNIWSYSNYDDGSKIITPEEIESKQFYDLKLISNKGKESLLINGFREWR